MFPQSVVISHKVNVCRTCAWHLIGYLLLVPNNCCSYGKKRDPAVYIWGMTNPLPLIFCVLYNIQILLKVWHFNTVESI